MARTAASGRVATAETWKVQYEANALPENATPAWTVGYSPDPLVASTVEINPAGKLHILADSSNPEIIAWVLNGVGFVDAVGSTVEFRMRMVSGDTFSGASDDCIFTIRTDATSVGLAIYTDGISDANTTYSFNTTDDYHIYRITISQSGYNIYVDGVSRITGTQGGSGNYIDLSPTSGAVDTEQLWDYVYYRTDGAFPANRSIASGRVAASGRVSV